LRDVINQSRTRAKKSINIAIDSHDRVMNEDVIMTLSRVKGRTVDDHLIGTIDDGMREQEMVGERKHRQAISDDSHIRFAVHSFEKPRAISMSQQQIVLLMAIDEI
jgi:hypothetical protein